MKSKSFVIADVFTSQRFGGNQLAVYTDSRGLNAAMMQDIAREMNYSETTFLLPPEQGGDYRVRIFTPRSELPFAGHPLVGSAFVIVAERMKEWSEPVTVLQLETGVGLIRVEVETKQGQAGHATMTQPLPVPKGIYTDTEKLAAALSIKASDIESTGLPMEPIYNGITTMIVPIATLAAVEQIKIDIGALERISHEAGVDTVLFFTLETLAPSSSVHCRVSAAAEGILEDAATGSANGPLGFYLVRHKLVDVKTLTKIVSEQGYEMKRPSLLHIEVETDPANGEVIGVRVGGGVVIAARGEMFVS
ncbi:MAG TPA: PhzF family phenazine biosynthesis protein [Blastocatellia bacterium]|nr:PhzF family phenazine biosynthesis protein [Blastocatellia bacterium]